MRSSVLLAVLISTSTLASNIILTNDDGWAEINIRVLYDALTAAGESVVLSAPAENESGTGRYIKHSAHIYVRERPLIVCI
jgi:5'/3'-nucleotidase SurE